MHDHSNLVGKLYKKLYVISYLECIFKLFQYEQLLPCMVPDFFTHGVEESAHNSFPSFTS